jgi:hypothetical protein
MPNEVVGNTSPTSKGARNPMAPSLVTQPAPLAPTNIPSTNSRTTTGVRNSTGNRARGVLGWVRPMRNRERNPLKVLRKSTGNAGLMFPAGAVDRTSTGRLDDVRSRAARLSKITHSRRPGMVQDCKVRLNLAVYFTGLAIRLQLGVIDCLAGHLLDCAF